MDKTALEQLGISTDDVIEKAARMVLDEIEGGDDYLSLSQRIERELMKKITDDLQKKLDGILERVTSNLLDQTYTPVDHWGDRTSEPTTLREMIKTKSIQYMMAKVDDSGREGYNAKRPRVEHLAIVAAKEAVDWRVTEELTKAVNKAKAEVKELCAKHIAEMLLKK